MYKCILTVLKRRIKFIQLFAITLTAMFCLFSSNVKLWFRQQVDHTDSLTHTDINGHLFDGRGSASFHDQPQPNPEWPVDSIANGSSMVRLDIPKSITGIFCHDIQSSNQSLIPNCQTNIQPALWIGNKEKYVTLVVGLPTMVRPVKQYFQATLQKLIRDLPPSERNSTLILIFLSDEDPSARELILKLLFGRFLNDIQSGLVEILIPNKHFYRTLVTSPCGWFMNERDETRPYNRTAVVDGPCDNKYLRWRNKQSFDYAYLMAYGSQLGKFYLQMEDDMSCEKELYPAVFKALRNYDTDPWIVAEVTQRGFRGKMFPSSHTFYLAQYLLQHYNEMPCDWLYPKFVENLQSPCDQEKYASSDCRLRKDPRKLILRGRDICTHRGQYSSLEGKIVPIHLEVVKVV